MKPKLEVAAENAGRYRYAPYAPAHTFIPF